MPLLYARRILSRSSFTSCPGQNGDGSETGFLQAHLMQRLDTGFDQGAVHDLWALLCVLDQTPEHALKLGRGVNLRSERCRLRVLQLYRLECPCCTTKGPNSTPNEALLCTRTTATSSFQPFVAYPPCQGSAS